ncbi:DUF2312 domain-containing protein [Methylorubrum zatmanii]
MSNPENPRAVPGDNSGEAPTVAGDQLKSILERIERLEEDKAAIAADIKDIYAEAKGVGFETKVIRKLVALRKQDQDDRAEFMAKLDLYASALGMRNVFA